MHNIQIGALVLNGQLVLYLIYGAAGWLVLQYRLRHRPERSVIVSYAGNAFWLWVIVWKASFVLFHLAEFIHQPVSLLYFDGGARGKWMASLIAAAYTGYRLSKQKLPMKVWIDIGAWFALGCWLVYHIFLLVLGEEPYGLYVVNAVVAAGLLIALWISRKGSAYE
ncbi:hypothetical protein WMW72_07030 [Paenibacillus filicis]|uniref:Uncharacterized protein n=1 Tax=Paenibacillus filicis TaxID=669464 RepID=A0ABU9DFL4_9BACL